MIFVKELFAFALLCTSVRSKPTEYGSSIPGSKTYYEVRVAQGYIVTREEVEVDRVHNYVVVHAPPIGDFKSLILFHDYNLNQTLFVYPTSKHCYLCDVYTDVPEDIEYWFQMRNQAETTYAFNGNDMAMYRTHLFRITERNVNRSFLTERMTHYCTEDMELRRVVIEGADSMALDSEMPNEPYEDMNIIYVPFVPETAERENRVKRASSNPPFQCSVRMH